MSKWYFVLSTGDVTFPEVSAAVAAGGCNHQLGSHGAQFSGATIQEPRFLVIA